MGQIVCKENNLAETKFKKDKFSVSCLLPALLGWELGDLFLAAQFPRKKTVVHTPCLRFVLIQQIAETQEEIDSWTSQWIETHQSFGDTSHIPDRAEWHMYSIGLQRKTVKTWKEITHNWTYDNDGNIYRIEQRNLVRRKCFEEVRFPPCLTDLILSYLKIAKVFPHPVALAAWWREGKKWSSVSSGMTLVRGITQASFVYLLKIFYEMEWADETGLVQSPEFEVDSSQEKITCSQHHGPLCEVDVLESIVFCPSKQKVLIKEFPQKKEES
jgi:hypothetical protein